MNAESRYNSLIDVQTGKFSSFRYDHLVILTPKQREEMANSTNVEPQ